VDGMEVVHFGRDLGISFDRVFVLEEAHKIKAKSQVSFGCFRCCVERLSGFSGDLGAQRV
jgi:hypothetical protein